MTVQTFELRDHLDHTWTDELVGFPIDGNVPDGPLAVRDEAGVRHACQLGDEDGRPRVHFLVDRLPALGTRRFELTRAADADLGAGPKAIDEGDTGGCLVRK